MNNQKLKQLKEREQELINELSNYMWWGNEDDVDYKEEYGREYEHLQNELYDIQRERRNLQNQSVMTQREKLALMNSLGKQWKSNQTKIDKILDRGNIITSDDLTTKDSLKFREYIFLRDYYKSEYNKAKNTITIK